MRQKKDIESRLRPPKIDREVSKRYATNIFFLAHQNEGAHTRADRELSVAEMPTAGVTCMYLTVCNPCEMLVPTQVGGIAATVQCRGRELWAWLTAETAQPL